VRVLLRETAGDGHVVDVGRRGDDVVVDRLHLDAAATRRSSRRHLGDDEVALTGAKFRDETAARHVTCITQTLVCASHGSFPCFSCFKKLFSNKTCLMFYGAS